MSARPVTVRMGSEIMPFSFEPKSRLDFGGRKMIFKQAVTWGAVVVANTLRMHFEQGRLFLEAIDYSGKTVNCEGPKRTFRLKNTDLRELVLPEQFICDAAREWLDQIGDRLILKIRAFDQFEGLLPSGMMTLCVGINPRSKKPQGILVLNAHQKASF